MASRRTANFLAQTLSHNRPSSSSLLSLSKLSRKPALVPTATTHQIITTTTTTPPSATSQRSFASYAVVHHEQEYKEQMEGRHGQSLKLAIKEGMEKRDGTHFDPFEAYALNDDDEVAEGQDDYGEQTDDDDIVEKYDEDEEKEEGMEESEDDDYDEEGEEEDIPTKEEAFLEMYNPDGSLRSTPTALRHAYNAGSPAGGNFAIINLQNANSQAKVTVNDVLIFNKLRPVRKWSVGSTHVLKEEEILLVGNQDKTLVGLPFVKGAEVEVMVEEITRDKTVLVFKKRRRKNSRRKNGHRREVTFLRVLDIRFPQEQQDQQLGEDEVSVSAA